MVKVIVVTTAYIFIHVSPHRELPNIMHGVCYLASNFSGISEENTMDIKDVWSVRVDNKNFKELQDQLMAKPNATELTKEAEERLNTEIAQYNKIWWRNQHKDPEKEKKIQELEEYCSDLCAEEKIPSKEDIQKMDELFKLLDGLKTTEEQISEDAGSETCQKCHYLSGNRCLQKPESKCLLVAEFRKREGK